MYGVDIMNNDSYTQYIEKEEKLNYPLFAIKDRPDIHYTYRIKCPVDLIDKIVYEWLKEKYHF